MKKLLIIFFLTAFVSSVSAQSKQETLKWLVKHKKYITMVNPSGYSSEKFKVEMTDSYIRAETQIDGKKYETKLYWLQIKETMLGLTKGEAGYVTLHTENQELFAPSITLYLSDYSTEMREKLTHMANLNGTDVRMQTLDLR
jgi:uncharacterized membrane protein